MRLGNGDWWSPDCAHLQPFVELLRNRLSHVLALLDDLVERPPNGKQ